ncbi:hypothetical protein L6R52_11030 [Myxococcota bacterium]|nr:hypothetical protein [Myxococcota bacterium]
MLLQFFVVLHVVATVTWVGAVFMGSFVDWPVLVGATRGGRFPFDFIVGQGRRVFPAVYVGVTSMIVSSIGLVWLKPPRDALDVALLIPKGLALAFMVGSTLYGTFVTWPKLQFATDAEAFGIYRWYNLRANVVFVVGIVATVCGLFLSRRSLWLPGVDG